MLITNNRSYIDTLSGTTVDGSDILTTVTGAAISPAPTILHEGSGTNLLNFSDEFSNAAWVKTNVTVTENSSVSPNGYMTADTLKADADNGTILQILALSIDDYNGSFYLKRKTGSGTIELTLDNAATWVAVAVSAGWTRFDITQNLANPVVGIRLTTNTDEIYAWGGQCEQGLYPTSIIPTTTAAASRASDDISITLSAGTNFVQQQGILLFKWVPGYDSETTLNELFSINDSSGLFSDSATINTLTSTDGTNTINTANTFIKGEEILASIIWNAVESSFSISYSKDGGGTWAAWVSGTYDGAFTTGTDINLFHNNPFINNLVRVKIYDQLTGGTIATAQPWVEANAGTLTS